jgi:succinate dehydrogenase / fumarate reductase flavoprotein subunit
VGIDDGPPSLASDLDEALDELSVLRERAATMSAAGGRAYNPGWNLVFELDHLLTVSEAITRSARERKESRGAHSRLYHPATDDATWGKVNVVVAREPDGSMAVTTTPLPAMPDELLALLDGGH